MTAHSTFSFSKKLHWDLNYKKYHSCINSCNTGTTVISAKSIDQLVCAGITHIINTGEISKATAGEMIQSYDVQYVLIGSRNRLHRLRGHTSIGYLARELNAYMTGGLNVETMTQASRFWKKLADNNGKICSNYGHWVWHFIVPKLGLNQYDYIIKTLHNSKSSIHSRKALININQPKHKFPSNKDFPCTIGIQFYTKPVPQNKSLRSLECRVSSRSTDITTGLPYDMAFFALLNEMIYMHLVELGHKNIILGNTRMNTSFTQIYDSGVKYVNAINKSLKNINFQKKNQTDFKQMPAIESAKELYADIKNKTYKTSLRRWIKDNSKY